MKKLFLLLLTVFALNGCENEPEIISLDDANKDAAKFDVCHYSRDTDSWDVINIAEIAYLKAHIEHGDTKLVDADGDGYVTLENECLPYGDCDDTNPSIHPGAIEVCDGLDNDCDGIVDEGCNQNGFADYSFETMLPNFSKGTYNILTEFDCNSSLTDDGKEIFSANNVGGSSLISQSLAMNVMNLMGYSLYKTYEEITYNDNTGKKLDMIVSSGNTNYGVEVTKAVTFPFGLPYSASQATSLLESKLSDILNAEANLSALNQIESSLLFIFAWDAQHAEVVTSVWNNLNATIKADVTLILMTTEGMDEFVYTGSITTNEEICDGLDNDCDGEVDEGCNQNDFANFLIESDFPLFFRGTYDIKSEFDYSFLSTDGQAVYDSNNVGGSSLISQSLAMNVMNLMGHSLYKTYEEITYDDNTGKKLDMLVSTGNTNYSVIVTRAFSFPPGSIYSYSQATSLLESKLSDLKQAEVNLSALNKVDSSLLFIFAYDSQLANVISDVWNGLDTTVKLNVRLCLISTDGSDGFIYSL